MPTTENPADRPAVQALRTLGDELEALPDDHPRVRAIHESLRYCNGAAPSDLDEPATKAWMSRPNIDARRVEGAVAFEAASRQRESPARNADHEVTIAFPGPRDWCEWIDYSLTRLHARMSTDPNARGLLRSAPAIAVVQPEDGDDLWEVCLSWVELPAAGAWFAAQRAMSLLEIVVPQLPAHPAVRVQAANWQAAGGRYETE